MAPQNNFPQPLIDESDKRIVENSRRHSRYIFLENLHVALTWRQQKKKNW